MNVCISEEISVFLLFGYLSSVTFVHETFKRVQITRKWNVEAAVVPPHLHLWFRAVLICDRRSVSNCHLPFSIGAGRPICHNDCLMMSRFNYYHLDHTSSSSLVPMEIIRQVFLSWWRAGGGSWVKGRNENGKWNPETKELKEKEKMRGKWWKIKIEENFTKRRRCRMLIKPKLWEKHFLKAAVLQEKVQRLQSITSETSLLAIG